MIPPELRERLWPYLGGIARQNQKKALEVGGMPDHIHILLSLTSTLSNATALQLIKGCSSKWLNDTGAAGANFAWQEGYGAFSVSASQTEGVVEYIKSQREHHNKRNYEEEFLEFLKRYGINYDPAHVLG